MLETIASLYTESNRIEPRFDLIWFGSVNVSLCLLDFGRPLTKISL